MRELRGYVVRSLRCRTPLLKHVLAHVVRGKRLLFRSPDCDGPIVWVVAVAVVRGKVARLDKG